MSQNVFSLQNQVYPALWSQSKMTMSKYQWNEKIQVRWFLKIFKLPIAFGWKYAIWPTIIGHNYLQWKLSVQYSKICSAAGKHLRSEHKVNMATTMPGSINDRCLLITQFYLFSKLVTLCNALLRVAVYEILLRDEFWIRFRLRNTYGNINDE